MEKNFNSDGAKITPKNGGKWKTVILAVILLSIPFVIWGFGLFRTPKYFKPVQIIDGNEISQYLLNDVLPPFFNKSQVPEPFEIVLLQDGVQEIVAHSVKSEDLKRWGFSDISITFLRGKILLAGKTKYRGFDFIVTAVFEPKIDEKGFNAGLARIRIGNTKIPYGPKLLRDRILYKLAGAGMNSDAVHYAGMLFSDNRIKPQFSFNHRNITVKSVSVENQKLRITFLPE
jgi:hypothetical protein